MLETILEQRREVIISIIFNSLLLPDQGSRASSNVHSHDWKPQFPLCPFVTTWSGSIQFFTKHHLLSDFRDNTGQTWSSKFVNLNSGSWCLTGSTIFSQCVPKSVFGQTSTDVFTLDFAALEGFSPNCTHTRLSGDFVCNRGSSKLSLTVKTHWRWTNRATAPLVCCCAHWCWQSRGKLAN